MGKVSQPSCNVFPKANWVN